MLLLFEYIEKELKKRTGVAIDSYNTSFILNRIEERMIQLGEIHQNEYLKILQNDAQEANTLIKTLGVNVSEFFRDPLTFEILEHRILPKLLIEKTQAGDKHLRIWCAGCASGEEPYSLAILVHELLGNQLPHWQVKIFATDIDNDNLVQAATGTYETERLNQIKLCHLNSSFKKNGSQFQIKKHIKRLVSFSIDDLTSENLNFPSDSIFGGFDLILCRNVMIYLSKTKRKATIKKLTMALNTDGYLILGESEWLDHDLPDELSKFNELDCIYIRDR